MPLATASVLGGIAGAILLLSLPASAFKKIVPAFIAIALVMIVLQPRLSRALATRRARDHDRTGPLGAAAGVWSGVYGRYFGAAQGILLLAILGLSLEGEDLQRINALKVVLAGAVTTVGRL